MRKLVYKKYKTRVTSVRSRNTRQQLQAVASNQTRSSNKERRKEGQSLPPPPPSASYQIECSAIFPLNMLYFKLCCFFLAVLLFVLFCFLSLCLQLPFWPLSSHGKELQLQLGLRPRTGN